jgi:hypothetical protein
MDTPLVPSDDDTPLLSSGPVHLEDEENESSQMMALLMKRPEIEPTPLLLQQQAQQEQPEFSIVTVVSATLVLLQCGLVWGSYLSDSWCDTHLLTSIDWQRKYLPFLNDYTDTIIHSLDIGTILSIMRASQDYVLLAIVALTAVGIPCISIISNSMAVTKYYYNNSTMLTTATTASSPRDLVIRFSFMVIYLLVLLDLATGYITLEWTDTAFRIQNCIRGSMLCYLVGMTAAVGVVAVLRFGKTTTRQSPPSTTRIPPAAAFRYPWPVVESYNDDDDDDIMNISEEAVAAAAAARRENSWYLCMTWQLGLATAVLLLPSLSLPLMRITYQGLAAEFMQNVEHYIYLWQLPLLLWHPCKGNKWMVLVSEAVLILQTAILPLVALVCGLMSLRHQSSISKSCHYRKCLLYLHPMVNGITLALTVVLFVPALESITHYLLNDDNQNDRSEGLCEKFNETVGEPCLAVGGTILPGAWFFLVQSVLLEVFCFLTLSSAR